MAYEINELSPSALRELAAVTSNKPTINKRYCACCGKDITNKKQCEVDAEIFCIDCGMDMGAFDEEW